MTATREALDTLLRLPSTEEAAEAVYGKLVEQEEASPHSCGGCETRWGGRTAAHCPMCHSTFGSHFGFDDHRTGSIDARRCLPADEIRERGYERNERGVWRRPRPADSLPERGGDRG